MSNSENILHPLTREQFFSDHWEISPLHMERSNPEFFNSLLSIADIEALLSTGSQYYPDVQLVNSDADIPITEFTDDNQKIVTSGMWRHYHSGATLIVSGAARRFPKIGNLCRSVTSDLRMRSHANVYLSPGSHQGFNAHYDTHDVFVLQVSGHKEFRFYHSDIELPFVDDQFNPEHISASPESVQETVLLSPGDTLYIPRGVVHDAIAQGDEPSLHITLGVYPVVIRDILQEVIQVAAEGDVNFRRTVALNDAVTGDQLDEFRRLLSGALTPANYHMACSRVFDEVALDTIPPADGRLAARKLNNSSVIHIDPQSILSVERGNTGIKLRVAGQVLEFTEPFASAVEDLIEKRKLGVNKIRHLDREQRVALCEQLLDAGCVSVK